MHAARPDDEQSRPRIGARTQGRPPVAAPPPGQEKIPRPGATPPPPPIAPTELVPPARDVTGACDQSPPLGRPGSWIPWAIGGAVIALVFVAAIAAVTGAFWYRGGAERRLIDAWARETDGWPPSLRAPTMETWLRAYRKTRFAPGGDLAAGLDPEQVAGHLRFLNSALLTATVDRDAIDSVARVRELLRGLAALAGGTTDSSRLAAVGVSMPAEESGEASLVAAWVNELVAENRLPQWDDRPIQVVQTWVDALWPLAVAVQAADDERAGDLPEVGVLRPALELAIDEGDEGDAAELAGWLVADSDRLTGIRSLADLRLKARLAQRDEPVADPKKPAALPPENPSADGQAERRRAEFEARQRMEAAARERELRRQAWAAFSARIQAATAESREWPAVGESLVLGRRVSLVDQLARDEIGIEAGHTGTWRPRVVRDLETEAPAAWVLLGLPDDPDARWGTLRLEPAADDRTQGELVFRPENQAPWICGSVPLRFIRPDDRAARTAPLTVTTRARSFSWEGSEAATWADLAGMRSGDDADAGPDPAAPPLDREATLEVPLGPAAGLGPGLRRCAPRLEVGLAAGRAGALDLRLEHEPSRPGDGREPGQGRSAGTIEVTAREGKPIRERFRWRAAVEDAGVTVTIERENPDPFFVRQARAAAARARQEIPSSTWGERVHALLEKRFGADARSLGPAAETGKRIGVVEINSLPNQEQVLERQRQEVDRRERAHREALRSGNPALVAQSEQALEAAREKVADLDERMAANLAEVESYAPWCYPAAGRDEHGREAVRTIGGWKRMAAEYVSEEGRYFLRHAGKPDRDAAQEAAREPRFVQEFLARHGPWRERVAASFGGPLRGDRAAEQNELVALLVLAEIDRFILAEPAAEAVRAAFAAKISDSLTATLFFDWEGEAGSGPLPATPLIAVNAAPPAELDLKTRK